MNHDLPWEHVEEPTYYQAVTEKMGPLPLQGRARFVIQGNEDYPDYQVEFPTGEVVSYRGWSHTRNNVVQRYPEENLSGAYDYKQVLTLLRACWDRHWQERHLWDPLRWDKYHGNAQAIVDALRLPKGAES